MTGEKFQFVQRVMSGEDRSARATALRGGLSIAEPFYSAAMRLRNRLFDYGIRHPHRLPRMVISVGNITTGGTGKTPFVRWLAEQLRLRGKRPAILSRGYKSEGGGLGDELAMLDRVLNDGREPKVFVAANPDRVAGAESVLRAHPEVDMFILDDGFQHRRVKRDFDVVLVSAANPFGFGHVLPRGLLREPMSGLTRADAVVITHADQVAGEVVDAVEQTVRKYHPHVSTYRAVHAQTGLRTPDTASAKASLVPMEDLANKPFFTFAGIANPRVFERALHAFGKSVGTRWFADHHAYTADDLRALREEAQKCGAGVLLTTEKDWVKLAGLYVHDTSLPPVWRVEMELKFLGDDGERFASKLKEAVG